MGGLCWISILFSFFLSFLMCCEIVEGVMFRVVVVVLNELWWMILVKVMRVG